MPRHAKNSTANACFTYEERSRLNYGTIKQRLGGDSIKPFDCCSLCLKPFVSPMACSEGHTFCRECILQNLLAQNTELKRQKKEYEAKVHSMREHARLETEAKQRAVVEAFNQSETSVLSSTSSNIFSRSEYSSVGTPKTETIPEGIKCVEIKGNKRYFVDFEKAAAKGLDVTELEKQKTFLENQLSTKPKIASFWDPTHTPEAGDSLIKKPSKHAICPAGSHPIRLKQLLSLHFSHLPNESSDSSSSSSSSGVEPSLICPKYQCAVCSKQITNVLKISAIKSCGHVFCTSCTKSIIEKDGSCYSCSSPILPQGILSLESGGTGYAGHGDQLEAVKITPAFI